MAPEMVKVLERLAAPLVPGYVALFDIADFKCRNSHLGHTLGDRDIAAFEGLAQAMLGGGGAWRRVGGGRWCAIVATAQLSILGDIARAYAQETPHRAGWDCWARGQDGTKRHGGEHGRVIVRRALRCGYLTLDDAYDLGARLETLDATVWRLPVNAACTVEGQAWPVPTTRWTCVDGPVPRDLYCPLCRGTEFTWTGGADDCAEGWCLRCGADLDFTFV